MQVGTGISILNGIAIGKIKIFKAPTYEISDSLVEDPIPELDRYEKARVKAQEQQNALYEKAVKAAGEDPYEQKLLGITAMRSMLGRKRFDEILGSMIIKPPGKPTLVPDTDKRPAITTTQIDFEREEIPHE